MKTPNKEARQTLETKQMCLTILAFSSSFVLDGGYCQFLHKFRVQFSSFICHNSTFDTSFIHFPFFCKPNFSVQLQTFPTRLRDNWCFSFLALNCKNIFVERNNLSYRRRRTNIWMETVFEQSCFRKRFRYLHVPFACLEIYEGS